MDQFQNYIALTESVLRAGSFKGYAMSLIDENIPIDELQQNLEVLDNLKTNIEAYHDIIDSLNSSDFRSENLIANTRTAINFESFAKKFIPDGAQAVFCYVGPLGGRNMDNTNFDNTGYSEQFDLRVAYYDEGANQLVEKVMKIVVPWFTDSTDASLYASALGNTEGVDYVISNETTNIISSPILTGATSGLEKTAEAEATR